MMSFLASFSLRGQKIKQGRRPVTQQDVFMFEAIVGKAADLPPSPAEEPANPQSTSEPSGPTIQAVVHRAWKPRVAQISVRLRAIYEHGIAHNAKHPQVAEWLRHLSDQAFKRIDQAGVRLSAARPSNRRRVEAREVMSIRPMTPESSDYKRIATSGNVAA